MAKQSAGILAYRKLNEVEVLLVRPGGPFWAKKDTGVWSIPKGEYELGEDPLKAAIREFEEELGIALSGDFRPLQPIKQKSGKTVYAWAIEENVDISEIKSNFFTMEWPPKSGKSASFPEVDKAGWFTPNIARVKIIPQQIPLIEELEMILN